MAGLALAAGWGTHGAAAPPSLDATFRAIITARYAAMARGDTAAVHRGISDDLDWVIGASGASVPAPRFLVLVSRAQAPAPTFEIDSVHARDLGGVATVTYRRTDHRRVGAYEATNLTRALEVYVRRDHRWRLLHHSHTWIVTAPPSIPLDSAALAAFVGHYAIGPGFIDDVHWVGHGLVATATGQTDGAALVPVSETAFSPDGVGPLMVFERDASGQVIGYVQGGPDGQVRRARRIQSP